MSKKNSSMFQNEKARMNADKSFAVASVADLNQAPVNNVAASVWNKGDVIDCAGIDDSDLVKQTFATSTNPTFLVLVEGKNAAGGDIAKRLYFSTLTRQIPEYRQNGETVEPTGVAKCAGDFSTGKDVFNAMSSAPTIGEQFNILKSYKTLEVVDIIEVPTARYQNGVQLNRLRTAKIPVFKATK